jgi:hypothetical protein
MHTALLIWKHSGHYNTSARMATLLREICNDLIQQVGARSWRGAGSCRIAAGNSLYVLVSWSRPAHTINPQHIHS